MESRIDFFSIVTFLPTFYIFKDLDKFIFGFYRVISIKKKKNLAVILLTTEEMIGSVISNTNPQIQILTKTN